MAQMDWAVIYVIVFGEICIEKHWSSGDSSGGKLK